MVATLVVIVFSLINCFLNIEFSSLSINNLSVVSENEHFRSTDVSMQQRFFHDTFGICLCMDTSEKPLHESIKTFSATVSPGLAAFIPIFRLWMIFRGQESAAND